ncbi:hypothetical protein BpHYR1_044862 [Brachionus plicatilis]|uniref:Uncharacterized protein n=1 Tax=Brachionus plicatilis TaxID=10195 RepID=A0A3M7R0W0_BRAPC|nr:hypothetical protein BpHYR1_044862 [Brachionus plicatilis]
MKFIPIHGRFHAFSQAIQNEHSVLNWKIPLLFSRVRVLRSPVQKQKSDSTIVLIIMKTMVSATSAYQNSRHFYFNIFFSKRLNFILQIVSADIFNVSSNSPSADTPLKLFHQSISSYKSCNHLLNTLNLILLKYLRKL